MTKEQSIYTDICSDCGMENTYKISDLSSDEKKFICLGCGKPQEPCDMCIYHTGHCGGCCEARKSIALDLAVLEEMKEEK